MATLLLAPPTSPPALPPVGTATLVIVLTPIRGADGQLRTQRLPIPAAQTVAAALPTSQRWLRVIHNGGVLTQAQQALRMLSAGDEILVIPAWGGEAALGYAIFALISIAVSLAVTYASAALFPPPKPAMQAPIEDPSFSFDGIRTTIGPGGVIPVIYGRQRTGGTLLSAAIDEILTVIDNGVGERRVTAIAGSSTISLLLALCEGSIDSVLTDTIEINGQPISNFPTAQVFWRGGQLDQSPIAEFLETRNTFAVGTILGIDSTIYSTTAPIDAFTLNFVFAEGLFFMSRHGEKQTNSTFINYRFRNTGGEWSPYFQYRVDASRTAPVRFGVRREGLFLATYDIEVFWASSWNTDETRSKWLPTLQSVTEITANTNAFPGTALLGIRAVATDELQGGIPNATVEVKGRIVRVNTFNPTETWSDNPAWCILDAMTNQRYGLGIADSAIDLGAWSTWAAYNDETVQGERRHTFNYILDREIRAQPFLLETMGGSRTMLLHSQGLWHPRPTRDEPPTQLLSWTNCTNVTLTYTRDPDRINVLESRFDNEDHGFQTEPMTWPPVDQWPAEVRKTSLDLRGITKPSRVIRAMQCELNRRRFENMTLALDASLEAITFAVHDLFRFSHPLPGWGESGRLVDNSTQEVLLLDAFVTLSPGLLYHVYVRHDDDTVEVKPIINTGSTTTTLTLASGWALSQTPTPRLSMWVLGTYTAQQVEQTGRVFRATKVQRKSDTTVHIEAVIHNPSIYDDADAVALPIITDLFNPLGPSPPLTHLLLTEVTRIQASGASLRVVNLSWDVAALGSGYAPYGGAQLLRRTVVDSAGAGTATAGTGDLGAIQNVGDGTANFAPLARVGGALDFDDYTVITGGTYIYRVIPISQRGVPNTTGSLDAIIHVAGPTTPDYSPGTVRNLRLKGQAVGMLTWEGRDVHLEWDPVADSPLFSETFFVQDYIVQVWAPVQLYLLRNTVVPGRPPGQPIEWTYTFEQNSEDQIQAGQAGARRDLAIYVWARTNTNRQSLDAATITVTNQPPDMSEILPDVTPLFQAALIQWNQWIEPRDFDHYTVYLDTQNPPVVLYEDIAISAHGQGRAFRKLFPGGLLADTPYWVQILPWDTFGPGIPSAIAAFTPASLTADSLDTTPPALPTGLSLSTGTSVSSDGTIMAWLQASWAPSPEPDIAGYELQFRIAPSTAPTTFTVGPAETTARLESVPGGVTIFVKLLTFDRFHNVSPFTAEASILTASDTVPPAAPTNLTAIGSIKSVALLWTPPADGDYAYSNVWSASVNNRASATVVGSGIFSFIHEGLGASDTRYYWLQSRDRSGNLSTAFFPVSPTAGIAGTAGQLDTTFISSLAANRIIAGTITALVNIGVANIQLDGVGSVIRIQDQNGTYRILLGKLGPLSVDWGLQIFNSAGQLMWNLTDGAQTPGIADSAITATKISAAVITATHLRTDTAVITVAAQIANALIGDAHITNLSASKILAGTIGASVFFGIGNRIVMDGVNDLLSVFDNNLTPRVQLGKVGGLSTDYGLRVFDAFGSLMWDLTSGATTLGITDFAVTNAKIANLAVDNAKIGNAAISNAKIGNLEVDSAKIANLTVGTGKIAPNAVTESITYTDATGVTVSFGEQEIASVTFPTLAAGDTVWVVISGTVLLPGGFSATARLREDGVGGTGHHTCAVGPDAGSHCAFLHGVFVAGSALSNKKFVLTLVSSTGGDTVTMAFIKIVTERFQK